MRRTSLTIVAAVVALSATIRLAPPVQAQRASALERENVNGRAAVAREVLVKFRDPLQTPELADVATQTDAQSVERVGTTGTLLLRSRSRSAATLIQALSQRPDVVYAEPNFIIQLASTPDDPRFPELWGLEQIGAVPAWDLTVGSTSTVVGVIDTGIDYTHPDLAANVWSAPAPFNVTVGDGVIHCAAGTHGFNAITRQCNPMDDHNHGTHVSGTIGAVGNNGVGVAGVNWTAQMMGIKVFDDQGSATTADTIAGVEFAIAVKQLFQTSDGANLRVLSASWGGPEFSQALFDQVNAASDAEMLFVAAAGNNGFDNDILPFYPASFDAPNVVAVGATSFNDDLTYFSNYGASSVHLAAPGDFILSTTIGNSYGYMSGTSMAAPHVSGAAALVLSHCTLDTATLKDVLLGSVDYLPGLTGTTITGGRVNVNSALSACTGPPATAPDLAAVGADTRVTLTWSAVPGAMQYDVKRSLTAGGPYTLLAPDVRATTYIDTAVTNDTTYYYVVSAENTLGESGNSNEASATPKIPPDLTVSVFTAPTVAGAGSSIAVSVTTFNRGNGVAQPSVTRLYLSDDTTFEATDTVLADAPVPELAPGSVAVASLSLQVPDTTSTGRYYLFAGADADDDLVESNESNNRLLRSIQIGPDLVVSAFTAPLSAAPGAGISVTDGTRNQGGGAAAATATTFYLSVNSTFSGDDVLLGSRPVPAVAAGATNTGAMTLTIPGPTSVGSYYILAIADGGNLLVETTENNNTYARPLQIGGDLVVSALTVPSTGAPGSTIVVADTTRNQGAALVGASTTRFYFSTNTTFDAADTLLVESREVPALDTGASSSGSTTVTLPTPIGTGTYYVIAKADADGEAGETSETNNTFTRTIRIGSDLVVSALTVPATAAAGAAITVTDTTTNGGADGAAGSVTRFYLSTNTTLDSSDTLLAPSRTIPSLAGGASSTGSSSLTLPAGIATATYYLIAQADGENAVLETIETNNTLTRTIQIGGDLIVSAFTVPVKAGGGTPLTVSDTTKNQTTAAVGPSVTKFYFSTNLSFDATDTLIGSRDVPALAGGAVSTAATTVTIPSSVAAGTYYLIARADADAGVAETNESNNTIWRSVLVGADLVITVPTATVKVAAGASLDFSETVTNQGGGSSTPSVTRYYLSTNSVFSADDVLLAGGRDVPGLPAGGVSAGSTSVLIPAGAAPGLSYLLAKADGDNTVGETSESNNVAGRAVLIGPDLVVSTASSPTSAAAGTAINVTDTVMNQGAGEAAPTVTRFYLSTNSAFDAADIALGPGRAVASLAAGTSNAGTTAVTIPTTTAVGSYYLLVKADGDNSVGESSETNNVYVRALQVTAAP